MSNEAYMIEDYPSLLWITIPSVLAISAYFIRKWYLARRLKVHGIGKGAPGFQTNVKRIRITPDIAARLRRGEEVSPEEIAGASARAEKMFESDSEKAGASMGGETAVEKPASEENVNEWLPESVTKPKKRGRAQKK
ncbi:hypothetical protein AX17_003708 [Amanita inopinata Kibby_2008]|nr:hypothetical protein AX17_003708 [Amanita inopinata Kibby_2008]